MEKVQKQRQADTTKHVFGVYLYCIFFETFKSISFFKCKGPKYFGICTSKSFKLAYHYENLSMQYIEILSVPKIENFTRKMLTVFLFLLKT